MLNNKLVRLVLFKIHSSGMIFFSDPEPAKSFGSDRISAPDPESNAGGLFDGKVSKSGVVNNRETIYSIVFTNIRTTLVVF
jgi:hypothetical protein